MPRWFEEVQVLGRTDPDPASVAGEPSYARIGAFGATVRTLTAQERVDSDYQAHESVAVLEAIRSPTTLALEAGRERLRRDGAVYDIDQVVEKLDKGRLQKLEIFVRRLGGVT